MSLLGVLYGGISGFVGGWVDNVMMRFVDIMYSIPFLLWVIMMMVYLREIMPENSGLIAMYIALGLVYWLPMARIVRGQILSLKEQEFVLAAHTIGASRTRILLRHLIPNCMGPVIVTATLAIPEAIFTEAFLSFIGLVYPPAGQLGHARFRRAGQPEIISAPALFPPRPSASLCWPLTSWATVCGMPWIRRCESRRVLWWDIYWK